MKNDAEAVKKDSLLAIYFRNQSKRMQDWLARYLPNEKVLCCASRGIKI